jgi:hypothetical protein
MKTTPIRFLAAALFPAKLFSLPEADEPGGPANGAQPR